MTNPRIWSPRARSRSLLTSDEIAFSAFIIQHRFLRGEELVAEAVERSRVLRRKGGTVSSRELLELVGRTEPSPALTAWIGAWNRENAR